MIPTSNNPSLPKYILLPKTNHNIDSKLSSVRNKLPNPTNYPIPQAASFNQLPTNTLPDTNIQIAHINTHSRSKTIISLISTQNLQKSTDQHLATNPDNTNTNLVSESKQINKKYSAFIRKRFSSINLPTTGNNNSTNLQILINN